MVLVDTSVWIRFLRGTELFASGLEQLLANQEVAGHEMVFGELLIGDVGGGRAALLAEYGRMHQARTAEHAEVVTFVRARSLGGRGLGWIDVHVLAAALTEGHLLWTADVRLGTAASELDVAYSP